MEVPEGGRPEDAPQQGDEDKRLGDIADFNDESAVFALDFVKKMNVAQSALDDQQHPVGEAPDHEGPVCAVPDAAYREDYQGVESPARHGDAVAAERNVEVVAEPGGERDVPPPPEFLHAARQVGRVEVVDQREPHGAGAAEGDAGVAEEVAVDLERVEQHPQQDVAAAVLERVGVDFVHVGPEIVGHHHLEEKSEQDESQAIGDIIVL